MKTHFKNLVSDLKDLSCWRAVGLLSLFLFLTNVL